MFSKKRRTNGIACKFYNVMAYLYLVVDIRMIYITFFLVRNKFHLSAIIVSISYHSTIYCFKTICYNFNITSLNINITKVSHPLKHRLFSFTFACRPPYPLSFNTWLIEVMQCVHILHPIFPMLPPLQGF